LGSVEFHRAASLIDSTRLVDSQATVDSAAGASARASPENKDHLSAMLGLYFNCFLPSFL
jgi:hypothetical protein